MQDKFRTIEARMARSVMGFAEKDAVSAIERSGCIAFVEQRDKEIFSPKFPTGHSYRVNLTIRNGRVSNTSIG